VTALYRPEAFEPLTETAWDEPRVRDAIRAIVADTDAALRGPKLLWRAHEWDRWHSTSPQKNVYVGAAGVLWALDQLRRREHAETTLDLPGLALRNLELFRAKPDYIKGWSTLPEPRDSSLLLGEAGILLVAWRLAPSDDVAGDLHMRVRANVDNDAVEVMWGSPGTLIAAQAMHDWTRDERWREAWNDTAEALLARRDHDGFWTSRLYGDEFKSLTPPHGVVGIVQALLPLLDEERASQLRRETAELLAAHVVRADGIANWPTRPGRDLTGPDGQIRVQWCAGSPGIVIGAADYLDEELLLAGAELPWHTGPKNLDKGPGICHGTAGNGYAFLKAFARMGDERWLDRARKFAVHALEQVERLPRRYALWTGQLGVALYAADCLDARTDYPFFDYV
jgi:Lanthionine synthetase C-like protein